MSLNDILLAASFHVLVFVIKDIIDECRLRHFRRLNDHVLVGRRALAGLSARILAVLLPFPRKLTVLEIS